MDFLESLGAVLPGLTSAVPGELEADGFPHLRRVIVDAEDPYPGCLRLADILEAAADGALDAALARAAAGVGPDDPLTILYTSGTTSFPKGAVISHRNAVPHGWYCGEVLGVTPADRVLHALPFSGTWGGLNIPLTTLSHGGALVLMETFEPAWRFTSWSASASPSGTRWTPWPSPCSTIPTWRAATARRSAPAASG